MGSGVLDEGLELLGITVDASVCIVSESEGTDAPLVVSGLEAEVVSCAFVVAVVAGGTVCVDGLVVTLASSVVAVEATGESVDSGGSVGVICDS